MPVNETEYKEKISGYDDRHKFWAGHAIKQFGNSINFFTTLGIGLVAFLIEKSSEIGNISIDFNGDIIWSQLWYVVSVVFAILTVVLGLIAVMTRLYNIRITRHLIWVRKSRFKKVHKFLPEGYIEISTKKLLRSLLEILFVQIKWIKKVDGKDSKQLIKNFEELRCQSKLLGELAWKCHKLQLLTIVLSLIFYVVY